VVVEVGKMRSPPHERKPDGTDTGGLARVFEDRSLDVAVETVGLAAEVRHEQAWSPVPERVSDGDPHACPGMVAEDSRSGLGGDLFEGAVPLVVKEPVGGA